MIYKYSVLTYIIGDYEDVHEILHKDDGIEYVLVTDNPNIKSDTWNVVYDEGLVGSTFDKCYKIRFNPFDYVNSDICLRIDGSIVVKGSLLPLFERFEEGGYEISLMIHPYRNLQSEEYAEWVKSRNYPQSQADKCMNYIKDTIGLDPCRYKGLYQMCYEIQRRDKNNVSLNKDTFDALKELGVNGCIERLDQTIFSAIFNKYYSFMKVMWISQMFITNSDVLEWTYHKSNERLMTFSEIEPYALNKPCVLCQTHQKKPKLLILSMSCSKQDFIDEENAVRETWAKPILDGEYDNVDWYAYRGGSMENCIDTKSHTIFVKADDDFLGTFNKTTECFSFLKELGFEFDYVLRTNCCTFINVREVENLLQSLKQNVVYTNEVNSYVDLNSNTRLLSFSGAFMLFSKELFNLFLQNSYSARLTDDCVFSNILREHYISYINHIEQLECAYIEDEKEISNVYCIKLKSFNNHLSHSIEDVIENYSLITNKGLGIRKQNYKIGSYKTKDEVARRVKYNDLNELLVARKLDGEWKYKSDYLLKFNHKKRGMTLIVIVSNDTHFSSQWVEHHLNIGFNQILILDNNQIEGRVLSNIVNTNENVIVLNYRGENLNILGEDNVCEDCICKYCSDSGAVYKVHSNQWIEGFNGEDIIVSEKPLVVDNNRTSERPLMSEDNTKIFILGYKQFKCPIHNSKLYRIVNLTADNSIKNDEKFHYDVPIIYTDKGVSISNMNNMYDEWCGIYWLWKNYDWSNTEYVGLCQYRRYFEFLDNPKWEHLNGADINVGQERRNFKYNNAVDYKVCHNIDDLSNLIKVFATEEKEATKLFLFSKTFFPSNLLILHKNDFFDLCAFAFGYIKKFQITYNLLTFEQIQDNVRANLNKYPLKENNTELTIRYQSQMLAFLMERLTNIWIHKQLICKRVVKIFPCIETEITGQGIFKYVKL